MDQLEIFCTIMKYTEEELDVGLQLCSFILSALHLWVH